MDMNEINEQAAKYAAASLTDRQLRDVIRWYEQADESEKDETDHILHRANVEELRRRYGRA